MFNQIVTNIDILKNDFVKAKDSRSDKSKEFISSLLALNSNLVVSKSSGDTKFNSFISMDGIDDACINHLKSMELNASDINDEIDSICTKDLVKKVKNSILTINLLFSPTDFDGDFTILTLSEYNKIISYYSSRRVQNSHINSVLLINMYLFIKMILNKNVYMNKKYGESPDYHYSRTETLSPNFIYHNLHISKNTMYEYTKYLIDMKLIRKIETDSTIGYTLVEN